MTTSSPSYDGSLGVYRTIALIAFCLFIIAAIHAYFPWSNRNAFHRSGECSRTVSADVSSTCSSVSMRVDDKDMQHSSHNGPSWSLSLAEGPADLKVDLLHDDGDRLSCDLYDHVRIGDIVQVVRWKGDVVMVSKKGYNAQTTLNPEYVWTESGITPLLMLGLVSVCTGLLFFFVYWNARNAN